MAIFAIPGLMPTGSPKQQSKHTANADGSLVLCVFSIKSDEPLPKVAFKIADGVGDVVVQDLVGACLFIEKVNAYTHGSIRIQAGVLPIGLMTMHLEYTNADGEKEYEDVDIEVPASPFHVASILDIT